MEIPFIKDLTQTFNVNIDDLNINDLNIDKRMIFIFNKFNYKLSIKDVYDYIKFIDYACIDVSEYKNIVNFITIDNFKYFQDLFENNNIMENLSIHLHYDIISQYKNFNLIKENWISHNYEWVFINKNYMLDDFCVYKYKCKHKYNVKFKYHNINNKIFSISPSSYGFYNLTIDSIMKDNEVNIDIKLKIIKYIIDKYNEKFYYTDIYYTFKEDYFELFKYIIYVNKYKFKKTSEFISILNNELKLQKYNKFFIYIIDNNLLNIDMDLYDNRKYIIKDNEILRETSELPSEGMKYISKDSETLMKTKKLKGNNIFKLVNNEVLLYYSIIHYNYEIFKYLINLKNLNIHLHIIKLTIMISHEIKNHNYIEKLIEINAHEKYNSELILFCKENNYKHMLKVLKN